MVRRSLPDYNDNDLVVGYYRYSSASQNEASIEQQREQVRRWAQAQGLQVVREYEDAAKTGAPTVTLSPSALQALLPERIGRFERTEIESAGMAGGAQASARYQAGDDDMKVEIIDMAAMGEKPAMRSGPQRLMM